MALSPTVRRLQLGRELRRLREVKSVTREAAAQELECDLSKISKFETGKLSLQAAEVRALLNLYGVTGDELDRIMELAREARRRNASRVPDWARTYVGLEAEAAEIKNYETELVPGLLQTETYTRAVTRAADPTRSPAEVERLVATRNERQARLLDHEAPQLWLVLNEAVIRRQVGGPAVMVEQLRRLLELGALPSVSLQVLPFTAGAHTVMGTSFIILRLADPPDAQVVYLEDLWSADYVDRPAQVAAYNSAFDHVSALALDTKDSAGMIEEVIGDLT